MTAELQDAVTLAEDFAAAAFRPSHGDVELEAAIQIELTICIHDHRYTREQRVAAWQEVERLHSQRRPEMVAWLEQQRGLK